MPARLSVEEQVEPDRYGMTRRRIMIALGTGGAACLSGYFTFRAASTTRRPAGKNAARFPRLRPDIVFDTENDRMTLRRPDGDHDERCAVNDAGAAVVKRMDGHHDIPAISRGLALELGIEPSADLNAKVAYFIAQIGEMDLLADPFYACLYEVTAAS